MTSNSRVITRRTMITQTGFAAAAVGLAGQVHAEAAPRPSDRPAAFKFSLNTATIRGQKLPLPEVVE